MECKLTFREKLKRGTISRIVVLFSVRLQFRFVHHQAAMVVALRHALDYLLVRAATTPSVIAEPNHMDEKILHAIRSPSWSVQLPYSVCETAFSQVGLFLD